MFSVHIVQGEEFMRIVATTLLGVLLLFNRGVAQPDDSLHWEKLSPIPDAEGFAGMFAGVSNGQLLVAGGANFPNGRPWEGGAKRWYDSVWALDEPHGTWTQVGHLPRPLGYGVSVTYRDGVICVGGSNSEGHFAGCFQLALKDGMLTTKVLPELPLPLANACGALVGDELFVAGGQDKPDSPVALNRVFVLNLSADDRRWREIDGWPGPGRILATACNFHNSFWLIGGAELSRGADGQIARRYLRDAYRFDQESGWNRLADLPRAVVAAPSPTRGIGTGPIILGGDDGTQIDEAPEHHRGFSRQILRYDQDANRWVVDGELPAAPVTTPVVLWGERWVIPSGEIQPGVRSPEVWAASRTPNSALKK